ncbi:zinc finger matrin-type protein CG9776-like isoform X2 [Fopius arisanus]|uniref:Zinc finger matrin-type protein CG9776-like isoform X2 n=1 Tax=Fopius arisanus TaxID=64838 RepID=A0A9R1U881_9HYME|nr:PREDICTED: zinc finger matrin-type protein CG9776-like isoform X2 [Fopius arisanus]
MDQETRRKGPRSPSADSDDSSHRRRSRKYDRDRSPSPRRMRYRRSRSRERRSGSRERRRKERSQDWNKTNPQPPAPAPTPTTGNSAYVPPVHNQYQAPPPPPTPQPPPQPIPPYNPGYGNYNYNYAPGYDYSYQQAAGYRSDYPPPNWQGGQVAYNNQPAPPPALPALSEPSRPVEPVPSGLTAPVPRPDDAKKEAEVKQQRATLVKQRDEYMKKSTTLQRELEILRQQCDEIGKESGRENNRIVKENQKLQVEIQNKMKSIHNVIDMLTGIIGDKATVEDLKAKFKETSKKLSRSPREDFPKANAPDTPEKTSDNEKDIKSDRDRKISRNIEEDSKPMYNFVHYDPEMHWCKICDIFPKTAKEYLNHLHSAEHKETCLERKIVDMPWHEKNGEGTEKEVPYYPGLPTKRTPIKGLQFFSAATAWYCKLCDSWIGDLHCASLHLKSKRHSENYSRFVEQSPHWETDWMADREKAFSDERQKQMQLELQKQKEDEPPALPPPKSKKSKKSKKTKKKSKKRKTKSSNSDSTSDTENTDTDSDQDMSKSIRVAMRNKMKASTQAILNEEIDYHGIKLKGHWSHAIQTKPDAHSQENDDRQLLNSIRDKLKAKQEEEMKQQNERRSSQDQQHKEVEPEKTYPTKPEPPLEAWGPKEPPKPFWIKKDEEKPQPAKSLDIPKPEEIPKPHMGFWTKQQVNMTVKPPEKSEKEEERDRDRDRDRYRDDRDRKYERRDDKYHSRYDRYDRRRDRDRDRDYYDDRRKDRRDESPRRERNWRESPKRGYDKYKDRRDEESNEESKFEKKTNESAKQKKSSAPLKKTSAQPPTKGKLPFIGRLPLFKKKNEEVKSTERDIAPLPYVQSKFEDTPQVPSEIINPPGVVHITKLATPLVLNNSIPTKSQAMKILVAPPPPVLHPSSVPKSTGLLAHPGPGVTQVVDMEIEDQSEETIIEEPIVENSKGNSSEVKTFDVNDVPTPVVFSATQPPPFIPANPPPFVQNATRFSVIPPNVDFTHPPPVQTPYPPPHPPVAMAGVEQVHEAVEIPEVGKTAADPSQPLPEDLQEALNIIFPKDCAEGGDELQVEHNVMYGSMYNSMLGCVGYGPEYMDQPPPEITQADVEPDGQPGPDDLRMLGIDEGDTIL